MNPGSVHPGSGTPRSYAPVASTSRRGRSDVRPAGVDGEQLGRPAAPQTWTPASRRRRALDAAQSGSGRPGTAGRAPTRRVGRRQTAACSTGHRAWPARRRGGPRTPASAAAAAAVRPAGPAPSTSSSGASTTGSSVVAGGTTSGSPARRGSHRMPSRTKVMHARAGAPSIDITHSWHTPIPQNTPRPSPLPVIRQIRTPASTSAAATLSPGRLATDVLRPAESGCRRAGADPGEARRTTP